MRAGEVAGERAGGRAVEPASLVIFAGVVAALHLTKLIPALPVLQRDLGLSLVQAGFLLSTVQVAGMALGLAIGLAADGLGLRRSLLVGLLTLSLASGAGGFAKDAQTLLALRVAEGVGFLLAVTPAPGLIRRMVAPGRIGKLLGLWSAYMPFATGLALLLGPFVIGHLGWQALWWGLAAGTLVLALWVWRALPADAASGNADLGEAVLSFTQAQAATPGLTAQMPARERLRLTLSQRGPWLVALCFSVYSFQWLAVIGFLPTLYAQTGLALGATALLTALAAAVNMVGNIVSGRLLSAGARPPRLLYAGYTVMAFSAFVAYVQWPADVGVEARFGVQYLAVLVFSMVGGVIPGTLFALAVKLAPGESTVSTTIGWMQQWSAIGQFFGPPLVAWVASQAGGWHWTWVVTGACAGIGLLLARQVDNLLQRPLPP